ncbi:MAG: magnesium/cobalt transporter CorA [Stellaceae bacterium]
MLDLAVTEPADTSRRGVIACALYSNGRRVRDVAVDEIGTFAGRDEGIVWLGLHEPEEALLATIQLQLGLHELIIEDANQAHQRAKLDIYDNVLFIALRTAQLDSKGISYGETHLIVGKGFVVSIRHGASASYSEVRQRCERNPELLRLGESAIMYAILDFVGDNYFPIIDKITEELEAIEDDLFSAMPAREKIERIYRLRAGLLNMRHAVSPMIEICNQLRRHDFPGRSSAIKPYLRDVNDHVLLVNEAIVDLRERLTAAFEASLLLSAARQNDIVKKLGSWAAILAVPTAIAGIYGMNFKYMPELEWSLGYPFALVLMLGICGTLFYCFRRAAWL